MIAMKRISARLLGGVVLALSHAPAAVAQDTVRVAVVATSGEPSAIGAVVALSRGAGPTLVRRIHSDGSYLSAGDGRAHFGLGANDDPVTLTVQWPEGPSEEWKGLEVDREHVLRQGEGK